MIFLVFMGRDGYNGLWFRKTYWRTTTEKRRIVAINSKEVEDRTIFEEEMIIKDKKYREEMDAEMDALERLISALKLER